jgi:hypothetical protein
MCSKGGAHSSRYKWEQGISADRRPISCLKYECWEGNWTLGNKSNSVNFTHTRGLQRGSGDL